MGGYETAEPAAGLEERVAQQHAGGVDQADDVAGVGIVDGLPVGAERGGGVLGGHVAACARVGDRHAALEVPGADAGERDAVAVRRIHVGLHLEDECAERRFQRTRCPVAVDTGGRRGSELDHRVEQGAHTEVGERRADEQRCGLAGQEGWQVEIGADGVEQADLVHRGPPHPAGTGVGGGEGGLDVGLDLERLRGTASRAGVGRVALGTTVDEPAELVAAAHRPRDGCGPQRDLLLDLVEQLERVATGPVVLVEERDDRQVA